MAYNICHHLVYWMQEKVGALKKKHHWTLLPTIFLQNNKLESFPCGIKYQKAKFRKLNRNLLPHSQQ